MASVVETAAVESRDWSRRVPIYYGWVNLGVAALAMTATLPGRTHGLGLITEPLLGDLGIDHTRYAAVNFCAIILGATFSIPAGRLLDRQGSRAVLTAVSAAESLSVVILMSAVREWLLLLVALVLVRGLGQSTLSVASTTLVGKWFVRRLGPAMGLFAVLLAVGFIATILGVGAGVRVHGWRAAWCAVGLTLLLGLAPLCFLVVRSQPAERETLVEGDKATESARESGLVDLSLGAALRTPAFWTYTLALALFGMVWSAITLFNEAILADRGFDARTFIQVMALLTASGLVSNLVGGWLLTRWPLGRLLGVALLLFAGSLACFPLIDEHVQVMGYALLLGVAGGLITVVHFAFYARAFGRTWLGQIQGAAQVVSVCASAMGPVVAAGCKGLTGSYDLLFQASAGLALFLGTLAWLIPLPARNG